MPITKEMNENIRILPKKIIHKDCKYVCNQLKLQVARPIKDKIGTYAYDLFDTQGRHYLFACKRYIDWSQENYGRVSFTKKLVELACLTNLTLIMLIEEEGRRYIYTFSPTQIIKTGYENEFNGQVMVNFPIWTAMNMEMTRRKEYMRLSVEMKKKTEKDEKDVMNVSIKRFIR